MHCKEINNSLLKLKRWASAHWFCYYDKVLWKKRILWYHFVTHKLLKNYDKWNNWKLKAVTFKALLKKNQKPLPHAYIPVKKILIQLILYIIQPLRNRAPRVFVKKTHWLYFINFPVVSLLKCFYNKLYWDLNVL